jgi:HlyD family secretion protein
MSTRPGSKRGRRATAVVATGVVVAATAGFASRGILAASTPRAALAVSVPVTTVHVVRTDVSARQVVAGTLGYSGVYAVGNELAGGIITWLPALGQIVRHGQALYQVAGQPVTLLYGPVPAYRDFGPGMTAGPDVRELQRNLAALGFDPGPADGTFGWQTQAAIERWQRSQDHAVTGIIPLGTVTFLPGALRVTMTPAPAGTLVTTGATVLSGTSDSPAVSIWLTVGEPVPRPGDRVLVTLPDGTTTVPGTVATVGQVATASGAAATEGAGAGGTGAGGTTGGAGQGGGGSSSAAFPVTISIADPQVPDGLDQASVQVAITQQLDRNVLAVPVTALLALPSGGYAVQVNNLAHQVIPVTTGLFDDATGLVEVSGHGLAAGLPVQAAQG